jgi:hypothetical protein
VDCGCRCGYGVVGRREEGECEHEVSDIEIAVGAREVEG